MNADREDTEGGTLLYRLEILGQVAETWLEWFQADTITPAGDNSVLEVRVTDQAELYGRLRRIHDLNLRLISVTLVSPGGAGKARGEGRE